MTLVNICTKIQAYPPPAPVRPGRGACSQPPQGGPLCPSPLCFWRRSGSAGSSACTAQTGCSPACCKVKNAKPPGPANAASPGVVLCGVIFQICPAGRHVRPAGHIQGNFPAGVCEPPWRRVRGSPGNFVGKGDTRVYLRSQKCWDIRQKAPDARRMSAALLCGMQANATQQMGLFGRIEQRWGVFRYTLGGKHF